MALALKAFVFPVTTFSFFLAYVETLENLILTKNFYHFFSQSPKKTKTAQGAGPLRGFIGL